MDQPKPVITICSSAAFYKHVGELYEQLQKMGFTVLIPDMALRMKADNDYDVSHYKTWLADPGDYDKKSQLMHDHFDKVAEGDAILVVNDEKHGVANYIGGNVLMEMALAFHLHKPILILYDYPADSSFDEEIRGLLPTVLQGNIAKLPELYQKISG